MMMLQTMIVRKGLIRINDQYPRSPRQTTRTTKTTSSSFDALSFRDRSSSFTAEVLSESGSKDVLAMQDTKKNYVASKADPRREADKWNFH
jgi:hypothetical protein